MNRTELTRVLAKIQLGDNRQVDNLIINEWMDNIGDLPFSDAIAAVSMHRKESTAYLLPAHIRENVRRIREARSMQQQSIEDREGSHVQTPRPLNEAAMSAAWNDPDEFARQVGIYNEQLASEGFEPVHEGAVRP